MLRLSAPFPRAVLLAWLTAGGALSLTALQSGGAQATPVPATAPDPGQATPPADKNAPEISQKEAPAVFKTRVDMVSVPVVVRDSKGHALGNLTKDNFQVFDKGKPQEILRFTVEKSGEQTIREPSAWLSRRQRSVSAFRHKA